MQYVICVIFIAASTLLGCVATNAEPLKTVILSNPETPTKTDTRPKELVPKTLKQRTDGDTEPEGWQGATPPTLTENESFDNASKEINEQTKKLWDAFQKSTKLFTDVHEVYEELKDVDEKFKARNEDTFNGFMNSANEKKKKVTKSTGEAEKKGNDIQSACNDAKNKIAEFTKFHSAITAKYNAAKTLNDTITNAMNAVIEILKDFNGNMETCPGHSNGHTKSTTDITQHVSNAIQESGKMTPITEEEKTKWNILKNVNTETDKLVGQITSLLGELDGLIKKDGGSAENTSISSEKSETKEKPQTHGSMTEHGVHTNAKNVNSGEKKTSDSSRGRHSSACSIFALILLCVLEFIIKTNGHLFLQ